MSTRVGGRRNMEPFSAAVLINLAGGLIQGAVNKLM